ncbi:unnamed protein product [Pedinophyceae sp. YPF-701]|nr:unnamed protein product [Pedinophyceae sp. YPF-701]
MGCRNSKLNGAIALVDEPVEAPGRGQGGARMNEAWHGPPYANQADGGRTDGVGNAGQAPGAPTPTGAELRWTGDGAKTSQTGTRQGGSEFESARDHGEYGTDGAVTLDDLPGGAPIGGGESMGHARQNDGGAAAVLDRLSDAGSAASVSGKEKARGQGGGPRGARSGEARGQGGTAGGDEAAGALEPKNDVQYFAVEWLRSNGMSKYVQAFLTSGFEDEDTLADLDHGDLDQIANFAGITIPPGHRKKILLAAQKLKHDTVSLPSGFNGQGIDLSAPGGGPARVSSQQAHLGAALYVSSARVAPAGGEFSAGAQHPEWASRAAALRAANSDVYGGPRRVAPAEVPCSGTLPVPRQAFGPAAADPAQQWAFPIGAPGDAARKGNRGHARVQSAQLEAQSSDWNVAGSARPSDGAGILEESSMPDLVGMAASSAKKKARKVHRACSALSTVQERATGKRPRATLNNDTLEVHDVEEDLAAPLPSTAAAPYAGGTGNTPPGSAGGRLAMRPDAPPSPPPGEHAPSMDITAPARAPAPTASPGTPPLRPPGSPLTASVTTSPQPSALPLRGVRSPDGSVAALPASSVIQAGAESVPEQALTSGAPHDRNSVSLTSVPAPGSDVPAANDPRPLSANIPSVARPDAMAPRSAQEQASEPTMSRPGSVGAAGPAHGSRPPTGGAHSTEQSRVVPLSAGESTRKSLSSLPEPPSQRLLVPSAPPDGPPGPAASASMNVRASAGPLPGAPEPAARAVAPGTSLTGARSLGAHAGRAAAIAAAPTEPTRPNMMIELAPASPWNGAKEAGSQPASRPTSQQAGAAANGPTRLSVRPASTQQERPRTMSGPVLGDPAAKVRLAPGDVEDGNNNNDENNNIVSEMSGVESDIQSRVENLKRQVAARDGLAAHGATAPGGGDWSALSDALEVLRLTKNQKAVEPVRAGLAAVEDSVAARIAALQGGTDRPRTPEHPPSTPPILTPAASQERPRPDTVGGERPFRGRDSILGHPVTPTGTGGRAQRQVAHRTETATSGDLECRPTSGGFDVVDVGGDSDEEEGSRRRNWAPAGPEIAVEVCGLSLEV